MNLNEMVGKLFKHKYLCKYEEWIVHKHLEKCLNDETIN